MKRIVLSLMILLAQVSTAKAAEAQGSDGLELKPLIQDGRPKVGIQHGVGFLTFTASVRSSDLTKESAAKVYARFVEQVSTKSFSDVIWQRSIVANVPAGSTYVVLADLRGFEANAVIAKLNTMTLALTILQSNGAEKTLYLDLGSMCVSHPGAFLNLDTGLSGCR